MAFSLQRRSTSSRIASQKLQQTSLLSIKAARLSHQVAIDSIDSKFGQVAARTDGEIMQDFVGVLGVDVAEELFSAGIFLVSLQRSAEGTVLIQSLFERWGRFENVLPQR